MSNQKLFEVAGTIQGSGHIDVVNNSMSVHTPGGIPVNAALQVTRLDAGAVVHVFIDEEEKATADAVGAVEFGMRTKQRPDLNPMCRIGYTVDNGTADIVLTGDVIWGVA